MLKQLRFLTVLYGISVLFSIGVLVKVFYDRYNLPEGVCPTAANNQYMYFAIGLLIVSTIVSTVSDRRLKKGREDSDSKTEE